MKEKVKLIVFLIILVLLGTACGSEEDVPEGDETSDAIAISTKIPSEETQAGPMPGRAYSGPLLDLEKASSGMLTLTVSQDASMIEKVSIVLMSVECETFSSGMMMQAVTGQYPIRGELLEAEISGIAQVQLQFYTPESVNGQVHVLLDPGTGAVCDIGSTAWVGLLVDDAAEPTEGLDQPAEPTAKPVPTEAPTEPSILTELQRTSLVNTPVPAPQVLRTVPPPDSPVLIINDRIVEKDEQILVTGEVENHTQETLYSMLVTVKLIDTGGAVLSEQEHYVITNTCRPGERTPFAQLMARPVGFAGYQLDVTYETTPSLPEDRLEVTEDYLLTDPLAHIIGRVRVVGDETVEFGSANGVFYDAEGKVIDVGLCHPPAAGSILSPGDLRPFSVIPLFGGGFDHYRLIIDRGLLGLPPYPELEIQDVLDQGSSLSGTIQNSSDKTAIFVFV